MINIQCTIDMINTWPLFWNVGPKAWNNIQGAKIKTINQEYYIQQNYPAKKPTKAK